MNKPNTYDHDAECEASLQEEVRRLRVNANRFLRQRNTLLEEMRLILAATQNWNGGWVGRGQNAKEVIDYITQTAGRAINNLGCNGQ